MISIKDYNVSDSLIIKVNRNIYLIIEFFEECCKSSEDEVFFIEILPYHLVKNNIQKCRKIVEKIKEYTLDAYYHELKPIEERALFGLFEWWIEVTENDTFDEVVESKEIKREDDKYIAEHINDINSYEDFMFQDFDFDEGFISDLLRLCNYNKNLADNLFNINLDEYIELMPDDIKEKYIQVNSNKIKKEKTGLECMIVKSIYNSIQLCKDNPRRLQSKSETELSDDIANIISEKLSTEGINIEREKPSGFAKKTVGELDFRISKREDGVLKVIAIGENKEWGKFSSQLKQLIGYMNCDISFGFTILFNKTVRLQHLIDERKKILENFYVEDSGSKKFKIIGEVQSVKGLNDVVVTLHENPEKDNSYFKIYHFIVNAKLDEREKAAIQART